MAKNSIGISQYRGKHEASQVALKLLSKKIDKDTLMLLSGGTSPDLLYQLIAQNKSLRPGAVALIDERYGLPLHADSNEKMIRDTGLISHLYKEGVPFYGILREEDPKIVAAKYEETIKKLFKEFPKKIAIMGIGIDGHTAGIKPDLAYEHNRLVIAYEDTAGSFGKRITLTFEALAEIDEFIILAFGKNKKRALEAMFETSDQQKTPAAFYVNSHRRTILLTDIALDQPKASS